ncbi:hypothetical protein GQ457_08G027710 [Hibiscus cannabinus]
MHLSQPTRGLLSQLSLHVGGLFWEPRCYSILECRTDKVQKRQSSQDICCSHGTPAGIVPHVKGIFPYFVRAQNPRTSRIKGTLKEINRELGRKERREKGEER